MITKELLSLVTQKLSEATDVDLPELEATWIIERALGLSRTDILKGLEVEVDQGQLNFIEEACRERSNGKPLAYILGEKGFYGINFHVNKNVLIPRPETELLVEHALKWAKGQQNKSFRILEFGAGSGCIGLTLLEKLKDAKLCAVDISVEAIDTVDFNRKSFGLDQRSEIMTLDVNTLTKEDLPSHFQGEADIIVANPPYIDINSGAVDENVKSFEPRAALFADENGFGDIRRWSEIASRLLAKSGIVLFEIGFDQGPMAVEHFNKLKIFTKVVLIKDYSGKGRVIFAVKG